MNLKEGAMQMNTGALNMAQGYQRLPSDNSAVREPELVEMLSRLQGNRKLAGDIASRLAQVCEKLFGPPLTGGIQGDKPREGGIMGEIRETLSSQDRVLEEISVLLSRLERLA